ncbi:MAG: hypothetical protein ACEQSB_00645 [Undibacterium sp.]
MGEELRMGAYGAVMVVARLLRSLNDANPDVGMGYSNAHFVDEAIKLLDVSGYDFGDAAAKKVAQEM